MTFGSKVALTGARDVKNAARLWLFCCTPALVCHLTMQLTTSTR